MFISTRVLAGLLTATLAPLGAAQVTFTVDTTLDTVDLNPGDGICADINGACSLRAAIQEANASGVSTVIRLDGNETYTLTLLGADEDVGATGDLDVATKVVIQGNNAIIDAAQLDRAFDVMPGAQLAMERTTIINGLVMASSGGAIRCAGSLTVERSTLMSNRAAGAGASGGAIFNDGGLVIVDRSTLRDNDAERAGGAIEALAGVTTIDRTDVVSNTVGAAPGNGGGLHVTGTGLVWVSRSLFDANTAASEGGGLWNSATGVMNVDRSVFTGNEANGLDADNGGGGLFTDGGELIVTRSTIEGNMAPEGSGSGGGVFNNGAAVLIDRTRIEGNSSKRAGGGIEALGGSTRVMKSQLLSNTTGVVPGNGGGLHLTGDGVVTVENSVVQGNAAGAEGGGLWNSSTGTMSVRSSMFRGNVASGVDSDQGGGGLFNDGGTLQVWNSLIRDNVANGALGSGGGILNNGGSLFVAESRLLGNFSQRAGGGIEANVGTTHLDDVRFQRNFTGPVPGNGGGLHLTGPGLVTIDGGSASKNGSTNEGGGLWNSATGTMIVNGMKILSNEAPFGPDVFNDGGIFTLDGDDVPVIGV